MTNATLEGWRHSSGIKEVSGVSWKVLERRTNQDQPMGSEYGKENCRILQEVEGSRINPFGKLSVDSAP